MQYNESTFFCDAIGFVHGFSQSTRYESFEEHVLEHTDKALQITFTNQQQNYKNIDFDEWLTKLNFKPIMSHTNPNTGNIVHMFMRDPSLKVEAKDRKSMTMYDKQYYANFEKEAKKSDFRQPVDTAYHFGGCCGWSCVLGMNKAIGHDDKFMERMIQLYGGIYYLQRKGKAFQIAVSRQVNVVGSYTSLDNYLTSKNWNRSYSFTNPHTGEQWDLYTFSENVVDRYVLKKPKSKPVPNKMLEEATYVPITFTTTSSF